jgi:outer membrane protein assembly factor BamB
LSAAGEIIVADGQGTVHAFAPAGHVRWTRPNPKPESLLTSPLIGPDGTIYLATELHIIALAANGAGRWQANLPTYSYSQPILRLSADGRYLAFQNYLLDAHTGASLVTAPVSLEMFIFGADGRVYLRKQSELEAWTLGEETIQITPRVKLDARGLGLDFSFPGDGGVLPGGQAWFQYDAPFGGSGKLVWTDSAGQTSEVLNTPRRRGAVLAIDRDRTAYVCDSYPGHPVVCSAYRPAGATVWEIELTRANTFVFGGALAPGRLYVVTGQGALYALGAGP